MQLNVHSSYLFHFYILFKTVQCFFNTVVQPTQNVQFIISDTLIRELAVFVLLNRLYVIACNCLYNFLLVFFYILCVHSK